MMLATGRASIPAALDLLDPLARGQDRERLAALRERLGAARLRVLVAGEANRGKSTLINALLGREVLPTGVTPLTAVATTVTQDTDEDIEVTFTSGRTQRFPITALADFGTERGNPGNCRDVAAITVRLDAPVLRHGVEIVDTPGTGSVHVHNTLAARLALPTMDAAIFVLAADPPVCVTERDLLEQVAGLSVAVFVLLNKADYLDDAGLREAQDFTAQVAAHAVGRPVRVYPLSARAALGAGSDPGFAAFAADFQAYLDTGRNADLQLSVAWHLQRIAQLMLDEVTLAERAARLPGARVAERVAAFAARLAAVADHTTSAEDRAEAESRRLLTALNAAADDARPRLSERLGIQLAEVLGQELAEAGPAEIERRGRVRLAELMAKAVDAWRQDQVSRIEAGLRGLYQQLNRELLAELTAVRGAAADLLGLDLALPATGLRLEPDLHFFYSFDERVDQAELLAGAVRRRLPGEAGRRLARQHLAGLVPELTDRQLGRARADLQYRLAESTRRMLADIGQSHRDSTERLTEALRHSAQIRTESAAEGERQLAELGTRERALRQVLGLLT